MPEKDVDLTDEFEDEFNDDNEFNDDDEYYD